MIKEQITPQTLVIKEQITHQNEDKVSGSIMPLELPQYSSWNPTHLSKLNVTVCQTIAIIHG